MISSMPALKASSVADVQDAVHQAAPMHARGGGTKPALSTPEPGVISLDMTPLAGIIEYEPSEYTFTASAGTRVRDVAAALAEHGQYMPFDPPLAEAGATLGGTIAAGLSGSGRYRYGGVRDFLMGVRFVDGAGRLVRGGGKVVKNAAGFDLPKLMVGSLGRYGVLVEVSFKVFPRPRAYATLRAEFPAIADSLSALRKLMAGPYDLEALDLAPDAGSDRVVLWVRLGGWQDALPDRLARLQSLVGAGEVIASESEAGVWDQVRELAWAPGGSWLVKVPVTPAALAALDQKLAGEGAQRRYVGGGNLAWIAWPGPISDLSALLARLSLAGLVIRGATERAEIGAYSASAFGARIQHALDPGGVFTAKAMAG